MDKCGNRFLLLRHHATTTICHSRTENLKSECLKADILIVAIGKRELIRGDWIKPGAVVIDCGINVEDMGNGKRRLYGDVCFEEAQKVAGWITPVPGGVGPMTVGEYILKYNKNVRNRLQCLSKTP